ncbi:MAG TPA: VOC family protein [Candidatus Binatia bacterium]|jgi:catechol 2,3-dioxygenase|nr:VOC family protein [Candidatus Binatia bacterium]
MIRTKGIHHMGIPVDDMDRAVKFYTEVLGMKVSKTGKDDMGKILARTELRSGDDLIVLFERPHLAKKNAIEEDGATHQAFEIEREDFELAAQKIKEWGVKLHARERVDRGGASGFYFFDTEGNLLQLYAPAR